MDQNLSNFDPPSSGEPTGGGRQPRFRLNLQTVATVVLVVALIAIVWLFFGPQPEPDVSQALPTPTTLVAGTAAASPMTASTAAGTPQVPVAGSPAVAAGDSATAGTSAPVVMGTSGTPMAPAGATTAAATVPPAGVATGAFVAIGNTDGYGIRLRFGPGADFATIRIILDGEVLQVVSGPESAEGLAWWRVQDSLGNVGWTAQDYLVPATQPANWAPPAASPTFQAGAGTSGQPAEATP